MSACAVAWLWLPGMKLHGCLFGGYPLWVAVKGNQLEHIGTPSYVSCVFSWPLEKEEPHPLPKPIQTSKLVDGHSKPANSWTCWRFLARLPSSRDQSSFNLWLPIDLRTSAPEETKRTRDQNHQFWFAERLGASWRGP